MQYLHKKNNRAAQGYCIYFFRAGPGRIFSGKARKNRAFRSNSSKSLRLFCGISASIPCAEEQFGLRACLQSAILALQTPKFYLTGSKRARKPGFLQSIDRKNPQVEQALKSTRYYPWQGAGE
jgi:hypothetical protein